MCSMVATVSTTALDTGQVLRVDFRDCHHIHNKTAMGETH